MIDQLRAVIGREVTFRADFSDDAEEPLDLQSAPTFKIYSHDGDFITSGSGAQDMGAPAYWTASVTIPTSAPTTDEPEQFYKIKWRATDETGDEWTQIERFKVFSGLDEEDGPIEPVIIMQGDLDAEDMIRADKVVTNISIKLVDPFTNDSEEIYSEMNPDAYSTNGAYVYKVTLDLEEVAAELNPGVLCRQLQWTITYDDGKRSREIHDLYIINSMMAKYISDVRSRIDKGGLWDFNAALRIHDWEICGALLIGLDRMNVNPATITAFNLGNIPLSFNSFLLDLTCIEILRRLYLAYGMSAFDFSGQATQLSSDQTQYIQTMIDALGSDISENIRKAKKMFIRKKGGVLHISVGPNTVYPSLMNSASYLRARMYAAVNYVI